VVSCPGTDTCKLGIASSRGLAAELRGRLNARAESLDPAVRELHIKASGCFTSCGQHHLADIGFYGVSRKIGGTAVPHFRVLLGGQWDNNGGSYGLTIGAVPSKRIPEFVDRVLAKYLAEREAGERFRDFTQRIGKKELKAVLDEFASVPPYSVDSSSYSDWRDPREFTIGDIGTGECAGAVVPRVEFELQAAEQRSFEAALYLEQGEFEKADEAAYAAMLQAAKGLVSTQLWDIGEDAEQIVSEFRRRFYDTQLFQSMGAGQYAGGKFAQFLLARHADSARVYSADNARHLIEEAQLFIEAAYDCNSRLDVSFGAAAPAPALI
jgi:sulfite reductase (ferredoxin)